MQKGLDLNPIYSLRHTFTVLGVTGRSGSGCTEVAEILGKGFIEKECVPPEIVDQFEILDEKTGLKNNVRYEHNDFRKYRIVYNYAKDNFTSYQVIPYKNVLVLLLLKHDLPELYRFIDGLKKVDQIIGNRKILEKFNNRDLNFSSVKAELTKQKDDYERYHDRITRISSWNTREVTAPDLDSIEEIFFSADFEAFCVRFHRALSFQSKVQRVLLLHELANNLRRYGHPFKNGVESANNVYSIVSIINLLIRAYRKKKADGVKSQMVIDSLRNPLEIMYLRERYAAFYMISINREDENRKKAINNHYLREKYDARLIDEEEYKGALRGEFYKQKVSECIQKSDIHLNNTSYEDARMFNTKLLLGSERGSPKFDLWGQILKFVSLICQPGIVPPSPEERCMQIAFTAKYNSGCISRQVGAVVADENYSIKSIGWNNTPEGQVPCLLRSAEDFLEKRDIKAFSNYETGTRDFRTAVDSNYRIQISVANKNQLLGGRNVCFCFKSLKNSIDEGRNQVHTRSLHAEENAFLQITKYGGSGLKNGKLFTTASPCELCSKKAYQLGIKYIYYIDPYPGISLSHILKGIDPARNPEIRLFNGAIGKAYHRLYEPFMSYKDELSLILGHEVKDKIAQLEEENDGLKKENAQLKEKKRK